MKYRGRTEIIAAVLRAASERSTKTKIMYKAYLSYSQENWYLTFVLDQDLVQYDESSQVYSLTKKGWQYLEAYDNMIKLVSLQTENRQKNWI